MNLLSIRVALLFPAAVAFIAATSLAGVVVVEPAGKVPTLAEAIALVSPGDTVLVEAGTYREHDLTIDKPITLQGRDWPVLDAAGRGPLLEITAPDVSVSGLVFRHVPVSHLKEHAAVLINHSRNCEIRDNRFEDNFFAVYVAKSDHCRIVGNQISASPPELTAAGNGVHLWNCRDIAVVGNTVRGHRDGVYLEFVRNSVVADNRSEQNLRYGLHFMYSDSCRYERNRFLRNGSGVAVMYTNNVEMEENTFVDNWGAAAYGLLLKDIRNSRVRRNTFSGNSVGIYMEGSDRVEVADNRFTANGWAIKIMANCVDSDFRNNDFIDNSFQVATNSRQSFSRFDGNYWSAYRGYDLDRDGYGDEPFRPVSLYSLLVESDPATLVLVRSLLVEVLNLAERIMPTLTPESLVDSRPRMRPIS